MAPDENGFKIMEAKDKIPLLLALVEEYTSVAYETRCAGQTDASFGQLMFSALLCLRVLLTKHTLPAQTEVRCRWRMAIILFEEVEPSSNDDAGAEIEEILGKAISIADRHKMIELKYSMQHLMTRVLFRSNPRAALRYLKSVVDDALTCTHIEWVIALNFLQASLRQQSASRQDSCAAIALLAQTSTFAVQYGHFAIASFAKTMEILSSLCASQHGRTEDTIGESLLSARQLLLKADPKHASGLQFLIAAVEMAAFLACPDPALAAQKLQDLHQALESVRDDSSWSEDGTLLIPFASQGHGTERGPLLQLPSGLLALKTIWLTKEGAYSLGFLLSGIALAPRNSTDGQKSEKMLLQGLRRLQAGSPVSAPYASSLWSANAVANLSVALHLHLAFLLCARSKWADAQQQVDLSTTHLHAPESLTFLKRLGLYLRGTLLQCNGHSHNSVEVYDELTKTTEDDIAVMAILNHGLLMGFSPTQSQEIGLAAVASICIGHPDRAIEAAYRLVSHLSATHPILATKTALNSALQAAKAMENSQLICMVLSVVSWRFYKGVVGEQAEKSARASKAMALKIGDALWTAACISMLADTLQLEGRLQDAAVERRHGGLIVARLPTMVQQTIDHG